MYVTMIVNGEQVRVNAHSNRAAFNAIEKALKKSKNLGRSLMEWELRDKVGCLLERTRTPKELYWKRGERLFLSLGVGGGG
jgi:hypothetical protein